jgi:hypothetical protein
MIAPARRLAGLSLFAATVAVTLVVASFASATTYTVRPDGSGDFPTIQAALDAVADGDVIELTDGTFTGDGNRDVDFLGKAVTVRSQGGDPSACILDCEGTVELPRRGFVFRSGETSAARLEGVTITGGWVTTSPHGGAILCEKASSPSIDDCIFTGNQWAAICCVGGSEPTIDDCLFTDNFGREGGAVSHEESHPRLTGCDFVDNQAEYQGGACHGHASSIELTDCRFDGNSAGNGGAVAALCGGGVIATDCQFIDNTGGSGTGAVLLFCFIDGTFERCTFAGNSALYAGAISAGKMTGALIRECTFYGNQATFGAAICSDGDRDMQIENTIIAFGTTGVAIHCEYSVYLSCCNLFGNEGGDWVGGISGQAGQAGNMCADPLFCDAAAGDFTLDEQSPCAPAHSGGCELIGAWGVGCGSVPVTATTWGRIKGFYRQ